MIKYIGSLLASLTLFLLATTHSYASDYIVTHTFDKQNPPGNIAVSQQGRIFMSTHHFYGADYKIVEVLGNGKTAAYPNKAFSESLNPVLGVIVDKNNILWMLETAKGKDKAGRLIGWDIANNQLYKIIYIAAPTIPENSFLNDLAVDNDNQAIYITDTAAGSNSALIVVDLQTGETRRVLEGSAFTRPEDIDMIIDGNTVTLGGTKARIGANPITIDKDNQWVYFAPMSGTSLYRVRTSDLLNTALTKQQLEQRVELYAKKPISDGITIDDANTIYITDITNHSLGYITSDRQYKVLSSDNEKLSWPDGFSTGPNGSIYATVNKLHLSPVLNGGKDGSGNQYYIIQFKALANTTIGR